MPGSTGRSPKNYHMSIIPMSERQQMKLVRQLETCDGSGDNSKNMKDSLHNRTRSKSCNGRGETPLHKAAIKGDKDLVIKLLEEGADPNVADFAGWTPLHEACNHGWYEVALALVQAGASVNATGFDDDTPLHDAAINGHSKLVRLLLKSGADVHFRNKGGKTPSDVAPPGIIPFLLTNTDNGNDLVNKLDVILEDNSNEGDLTAISERRCSPSRIKGEEM
ncbi:Cyclin-dependent kinase 4 inhibitor D, putative [Pediculus humanus corporis]|uniref:Cyclin-dependent kinase 4 inhibitor D, putative n=1 Tax=Pediculus humanus subsp. corporis TaxID=121224 RepID=E0W1Y1_PEDHC|nr:Cyclin-dependent kinase 4 inhibitor D, putative [Pediculus humanus corporis]EEB19575.1 Cyclin-dependent kinase 4 inhibitor D, putative [Pediculus humanus corporis]